MVALELSVLDHKIRGPLSKIISPKQFVKIYSSTRSWYLDQLSTTNIKSNAPLKMTEFLGINFRNDLGPAAGMDKDGDLLAFNYLIGAGFATIGTVLSHPNEGNLIDGFFGKKVNPWTPLPYSESAINTMGLPQKGIDYVIEKVETFKEKFQPENFPIEINIMEHPKQQGEEKFQNLLRCAQKALTIADILVYNDSCPNVHHSQEVNEKREKIKSLVNLRNDYVKFVPIFIKLRDFGSVEETVRFYSELGVDGLEGTNTQINYDQLRNNIHQHDQKIFDYYTQNNKGGVSGKAIEDFSYNEIQKASREIKSQGSGLKLIHTGGIGTPQAMQRSRALDPQIVKLRKWYTRFFSQLATKPTEEIYKKMVCAGDTTCI